MARRRIEVKKTNKVNRAVDINLTRKTRKVQVIQKHRAKNQNGVVIVKPEPNAKEQAIKIKRQAVAVEAVRTKGQRNIIRYNKNRPIVKNENYHKLNDLKNTGIGKILVMVACGPSVLEVDLKPLVDQDNIDIMVINKPLNDIWPPKYWAFCDDSQRRRNETLFANYQGIIINSSAVKGPRKSNQIIITAKHGVGVSRNLHEGYIIGRSSVYANLQVGLWMNYDKIFVFGIDMCEVNGKTHHYGSNPDVKKEKRLERFEIEAFNYDKMAEKLPDDLRSKIYFCSSYNPWEFTKKFNKWNHKGAVEKILSISNE